MYEQKERKGVTAEVLKATPCTNSLWPTNWRASTFVFDKLSRQFMQRCARGFDDVEICFIPSQTPGQSSEGLRGRMVINRGHKVAAVLIFNTIVD